VKGTGELVEIDKTFLQMFWGRRGERWLSAVLLMKNDLSMKHRSQCFPASFILDVGVTLAQ
jgi:hypothetical protein